ncbi:MAG: FimB/Mfa2 family fimbrial subunit [Bacteroidota bacterium]|nr:FimB/Mfa2 family fimbrial subunit [Bacteroidota bacterium]
MSNTKKQSIILVAALLLTGLLSSCLKEDFSDCPRPFRLFIKAVDTDEKDITDSGDVQQVILFVFNENGEIVDAVVLDAAAVKSRNPVGIKLDYPGHQSLSFVAWGNTSGVDFPDKASVKQLNDLYAKLRAQDDKLKEQGQNGTAQSPSDLFYGNLTVPVEYGSIEPTGDQTVTIRRKTAQVAISAIHLKQWNENKEGEYSFRLKESLNTYDQDGNLTGTAVNYIPVSQLKDGTLTAPVFKTYPNGTGQSFSLEILFNGEVIYSTNKGADGKAFVPEVGRLLNIIIDFRAEVSVMSVITPWGVVHQYVVF